MFDTGPPSIRSIYHWWRRNYGRVFLTSKTRGKDDVRECYGERSSSFSKMRIYKKNCDFRKRRRSLFSFNFDDDDIIYVI